MTLDTTSLARSTTARSTLDARPARGRGDPHHPRGRRRVRASRAAVLRRQGLRRRAAPRDQGVRARARAVPGAARRHRPQLPRGARVPRRDRRSASASGSKSPACRTTSTTAACRSAPTAPATRCRRCRCSTRSPPAATTPSSAAPAATRTRRAPRSGSSRCATSSGSGIRATSAPSCGACTTAATRPASTCARSRSRTGPSSTSGATSSARASRSRRCTSRTSARCMRATACGAPVGEFSPPRADETIERRTVRYRTVGDMSCTGAVESDAADLASIVTRGRPLHPHRARRDARRRPHLGGRHGRPQEGRVLLMTARTDVSRDVARRRDVADRARRCSGSRRRARSTTASRRSSDGCCTTRRRSSPTSSSRSPRTSAERGFAHGDFDFALLTDGLRAEREQGITIDVAYRYFSTGARSFILADCPGHVQYTRNMVTGATTADAVVVLIDGRKGVLEQTRRHLAVVALLRVPHVIVAVNKIDLLGFSRGRVRAGRRAGARRHRRARHRGRARPAGLGARGRQHRRALRAHALVRRPGAARAARVASRRRTSSSTALEPFRLPVQLVLRPQGGLSPELAADPAEAERLRDYRAVAGRISSGSVRVGDRVEIFPTGIATTVTGIQVAGAEVDEAVAPQSVSLQLADDVDTARGALVVAAGTLPAGAPRDRRRAVPARRPAAHHRQRACSSSTAPRRCRRSSPQIESRYDLDALAHEPADALADERHRPRAPAPGGRPAARAVRARTATGARSSSSIRPTARHSPPASRATEQPRTPPHRNAHLKEANREHHPHRDDDHHSGTCGR